MNLLATLLAQAPATPTQTPQAAPNPMALMLPIFAAMIVFMFLSSRSQKKRQERERKELLEQLNKNVRVLTVGGVIGTVISVKDDEVVLKVDESTNTKMTFIKSAVQRVLTEGS